MYAVVADQPGGAEVLRWREVAVPVPGPAEVLVQTAAVGVNFIETYQRSGVYPVAFPFTPGSEASGTVTAVGADVSGVRVGDRVMTSQGVASYAEYFIAPAEQLIAVPRTVPFDLAAALPLQGGTAHYLAHDAARPVAGDTVLVHAGAGGVGLLLTQLLTNLGVRVITTASTPEKQALSREAGAVLTLGYDNFVGHVREFTDGVGVAVAYDGVGRDTFEGSLASLRVRGDLVLFGGSSGQVPPFDLQRLNAGGSLRVTRPGLPHFLRTADERAARYGALLADLATGMLDLRIGGRYPLTAAADAHHDLESRKTSGKLLLRCAEG